MAVDSALHEVASVTRTAQLIDHLRELRRRVPPSPVLYPHPMAWFRLRLRCRLCFLHGAEGAGFPEEHHCRKAPESDEKVLHLIYIMRGTPSRMIASVSYP